MLGLVGAGLTFTLFAAFLLCVGGVELAIAMGKWPTLLNPQTAFSPGAFFDIGHLLTALLSIAFAIVTRKNVCRLIAWALAACHVLGLAACIYIPMSHNFEGTDPVPNWWSDMEIMIAVSTIFAAISLTALRARSSAP